MPAVSSLSDAADPSARNRTVGTQAVVQPRLRAAIAAASGVDHGESVYRKAQCLGTAVYRAAVGGISEGVFHLGATDVAARERHGVGISGDSDIYAQSPPGRGRRVDDADSEPDRGPLLFDQLRLLGEYLYVR